MVKSKLKRLKKAEENRILKEHEGLYARLVEENYSEAALAEKSDFTEKPVRKGFAFPRWAIATVAAAAVTVITGVSFAAGLGGMFAPKKDFNNAAPGLQGPVTVTVSELESRLNCTSLNTSALGIKNVSEVYSGGEVGYFTVEVDTFHTFDMIVKVDPEISVPESIKPGANAVREVNRHGFEVAYTVSRRRLEDYFSFNTKAVVTTDSEVYYIRYNYSSSSPTCELLELIEECITPKA